MAAQPGLVNAPSTSRLLTTTSAEPGKLLVEVDLLRAAAGVGQHELINLLVPENFERCSRARSDGRGVVLFAEGIAPRQIFPVEIELLARQRQQIIHHPVGGPSPHQNRRKPVGASLSIRRWSLKYALSVS